MSIEDLIGIVKKHNIDAVHPGYGFLSESEVFAQRMWEEASAVVVGPGWDILANTGDKLKAKKLAEQCAYRLAWRNSRTDFIRQCPGFSSVANADQQRGRCSTICC